MPEAAAELAGLTLHSRGKVREMYDLGDRLLMVASDRISAYDVVLPTPIPDKGKVLTGLSVFWFERTAGHRPEPPGLDRRARRGPGPRAGGREARHLPGRVRGAGLPVRLGLEGVPARRASVCGIELPPGLRESDRLPEPIFTPATKAELGEHDENVDFERAAEIVGDRATDGGAAAALARAVRAFAAEHAERNGIILADTKFEFGRDASGRIVLADEVLTPDSSRFWPADRYEPGRSQPSFDKQYVRDWLDESGWDHTPPGPGAAGRGRGRHARQVRRGLRADRGQAVRATGSTPLRVRVLIRPKEGILDPQGQAVERALPALGYEGVSNVHVGRLVELDVRGDGDVAARVAEMCERLLANPLIESYEVEALRTNG